MTINELKQYNGRNGAKAYVAYKGKVYDVTQSSFWKGGEHEGMHSAGNSTAQELGDLRYANVYAAGLIFALFGIEQQHLLQSVAEHFKNDSTNEEAVKAGFAAGWI